MIIGITGKIGAGKSYLRKKFFENKFATIDVDELSHDLLHVKNRQIAELIFKNKKLLTKIENIIHPHVFTEIEKEIKKHKFDSLVIEFPLLFLDKFDGYCDKIILVKTDSIYLINTLTTERKYTRKDAINRLKVYDEFKIDDSEFDLIVNHSLAGDKDIYNIDKIMEKL